MTPSEIIMLISTIFTALAALAAFLSCRLNYCISKPKIKVYKSNDEDHFFYINDDDKYFAIIGMNFENTSGTAGVIDDIQIEYNGVPYHAEINLSNFQLKHDIIMEIMKTEKLSINKSKLKCPLKVDGYSITYGFLLICGLPKITSPIITANISYRILGRRKSKIIKNVSFPFYDHTKQNAT